MNYNTLTVDGSKFSRYENQIEVLNNPTVYYPDEIIGKYCKIFNTDAETEILKRVNYFGEELEVAVQNLFVRAVRYDEFISINDRLNSFISFSLVLLATRLNISATLLERLAMIFVGNLTYSFLAFLLTRIVVIGSEFFGINPGFSI